MHERQHMYSETLIAEFSLFPNDEFTKGNNLGTGAVDVFIINR